MPPSPRLRPTSGPLIKHLEQAPMLQWTMAGESPPRLPPTLAVKGVRRPRIQSPAQTPRQGPAWHAENPPASCCAALDVAPSIFVHALASHQPGPLTRANAALPLERRCRRRHLCPPRPRLTRGVQQRPGSRSSTRRPMRASTRARRAATAGQLSSRCSRLPPRSRSRTRSPHRHQPPRVEGEGGEGIVLPWRGVSAELDAQQRTPSCAAEITQRRCVRRRWLWQRRRLVLTSSSKRRVTSYEAVR